MTMQLPGLAGPVPHTETTAIVVAQAPQAAARDEDEGKASPIGLVVLILFFIAVVFLVRSMTKHLKRVPASFEKEPERDEKSADTEDTRES